MGGRSLWLGSYLILKRWGMCLVDGSGVLSICLKGYFAWWCCLHAGSLPTQVSARREGSGAQVPFPEMAAVHVALGSNTFASLPLPPPPSAWSSDAAAFSSNLRKAHALWAQLAAEVRATDLAAADAAGDTSLRACLARLRVRLCSGTLHERLCGVGWPQGCKLRSERSFRTPPPLQVQARQADWRQAFGQGLVPAGLPAPTACVGT